MKTIEEKAKECADKVIGNEQKGIAYYAFKSGVEFAQRWIPYPSKEIPELNKDYLIKRNILGVEEIDIMTFRNTKEVGQVFTKIIYADGMEGLQISPVTHYRQIELP